MGRDPFTDPGVRALSREVLVVTGADGVVVSASGPVEELLGVEPDEVVGRPWGEAFTLYDAAGRPLSAGTPPQVPVDSVVSCRGSQGQLRWLSARTAPLPGAAGDVLAHGLSLVDVTASVLAQRAATLASTSAEAARTVTREALVGLADDGTIWGVNAVGADLLGAEVDEVLSVPWWQLDWVFLDSDGSLLPVEQTPAAQCLQTGEPVTDEALGVRFPDGTERWFSVSATRIELAGRGVGVVASMVETTDRRRLGLELGGLVERFDATLGALDEALVWFDRSMRVVEVNAAAERLLEQPRERLLGASLSRLAEGVVSVDGRPADLTRLPAPRVATTGEPVAGVVFGLPSASGRLRWVRTSARPVARDGTVLVAFVDVTAEVHAAQRAREGERLLAEVFEAVTHGLALADAEGTVVRVNTTLARWMGREPAQLAGVRLEALVHPGDAPSALGEGAREVRLARRRGSWRVVELQGRAVTHRDQPGWLVSVRDLTASRAAVEQSRLAEQNLHAAVERWRGVAVAGDDVLGVLDAGGVVREVAYPPSRRHPASFPTERLVGQPALLFVHPGDVEEVAEAFDACVATPGARERVRCRLPLLADEGAADERSWVSVEVDFANLLEVPGVAGVVARIRGVGGGPAVVDGDRVPAAEHTAGHGLVLGLDGSILRASPALAALLGRSEHELAGALLAEFDALDPAGAARAVRELVAGSRRQVELRVPAADGEVHHLRLGLLGSPSSEGTDALVVAVEDATGDDDVRRALDAELEVVRDLLASAPEPEVLLDADGVVVVANLAWQLAVEAPGVSAGVGDDLGAALASSPGVRAADRTLVASGVRAVAAAGQAAFDHEVAVATPGGERRWRLRAHARPGGRGALVRLRDVTSERLDIERLAHESLHDEHTGLPNRRLLADRLGAAMRRSRHAGGIAAVLAVTLDGLDDLADAFGHSAVHGAVGVAAQRIADAVQAVEVGRIGSAELMAVLAPAGPTDLDAAARLVAVAMASPVAVPGVGEVVLVARVGLAAAGEHTLDPASLLSDALAAARSARAGRGPVVHFDARVRRAARQRFELEADLRRALHGEAEGGRFHLVFQPEVVLPGAVAVVGVEALLRWHHPVRGVVPPGEFIGLAEQRDLMPALGDVVVDLAAEAARDLRQALGQQAPVVWVNVSARQLAEPDRLLERLGQSCVDRGVPVEALGVELTESVLMQDAPRAVAVLQRLRDQGVRLAVDDFGTGYSSLAYLQRLPLDVLKVDRSFVAELEQGSSAPIVAAMASLARMLGLDVVAEGIETEAQAARVAELGAHVGQGFLFARPAPLEALLDAIAAGSLRVPGAAG